MTPVTRSASPPSAGGTLPSRSFRLREETGRVGGSVDGLDAVRQSVRLILSVERYHWLIHSWQYGVELSDLFGKPLSYALPEIERRIREALLQDDRVFRRAGFYLYKRTRRSGHGGFYRGDDARRAAREQGGDHINV